MRLPPLMLSGALVLSTAWAVAAAEYRLKVEAGELDRKDSIVWVEMPKVTGDRFVLKGEDGATVPFDRSVSGFGIFVEPELAKGKTKTYKLVPVPASESVMKVENDGQALKISSEGKPVFQYQMELGPVPDGVQPYFAHGAHLHPIYTPGGKIVTGNHPPDHRWHRGIWMAWTDTDYEGRHPDFWNMGKEKDGSLTGEVRFGKLLGSWEGSVQAGFVSRHDFIDHTSGQEKKVLEDMWTVRAFHIPKMNVIDFASLQRIAAGAPALKLPKYHYGGLGVRGNAAWDPVDQVTMLTSEGLDRLKGDNSKGKWVYLRGEVEGAQATLVVLIHPANFRFPQPLRLNPKNPQLCVAPSQDGEWEISPGKPYESQYRFLIIDGVPEAAVIDKAWRDYALPAKATVSEE